MSKPACPRCGSDKIIPQVALRYRNELGSRDLGVEVEGPPVFWIIKDQETGNFTVDICGECGHAELSVSNFQALYEKYQQRNIEDQV